MEKLSRRRFFSSVGAASAAASTLLADSGSTLPILAEDGCPEIVRESLDGAWLFKTDPHDEGESSGWYRPSTAGESWKAVTVPQTWQITSEASDYLGVACYRRSFTAPPHWAGKIVRLEFDAVYHTAAVWLNGQRIGEHVRKGYTAFTLDATPALHLGRLNDLILRVDNSFDSHMLPRGRSYDWAPTVALLAA